MTTTEKKQPELFADSDDIEIEVGEETALVRQAQAQDGSLADQLANMENGLALFERRTELLGQIRRAAIRSTNPRDWVLFRDKDGSVWGHLADSGAEKIAELYGVEITNVRPQRDGLFAPLRNLLGNGVVELRAQCDALCHFNGRALSFESSIRSTEDFTGRKVDDAGGITTSPDAPALEADLRQSLWTRLRAKAIRVLTGMAQVPVEELEQAWEGTRKSSAQCRKGHGFGSGKERAGQKVAEEGVPAAAAKLADEILRRVGGDEDAARKLLREITANPEKNFKGFDSAKRLTQAWQVDGAWKRLREHPTFGDQQTGGEEK